MKPIIITAVVLLSITSLPAQDNQIHVFLLAGQSNMEGQGVVDLDHPKYYNGGRGILNTVMKKNPARYAHLKNKDGSWVVRDDVLVRFQTRNELKRGGLSIGFAGYPGKHHIGPELQFGHIVGEHLEGPVLIIKTAWGGKSLFKDFRPPSAEGETGEYYTRMLNEYREAISKISQDFPTLANKDLHLAGFVWFQGWNDMYDESARLEYEQNLVHLIHDVRRDLGFDNIPVVIGELGNGGEDASDNMKKIRQAQEAAAKSAGKNVAFVKTTAFARPKEDSPNVGHGHHWFGNAESYFLIGDALGKKMVELLGR